MNIMIVSHFFAPYAQVGAKRMTALAKFLVDKGHSVTVVKANDAEYGGQIVEGQNTGARTVPLAKAYKNPIAKKAFRSHQYWQIVRTLVKQEKYNAVIISGGPFNYFSIIPKIKKMDSSIKCILDFRDLLDGTQGKNKKGSVLEQIGYFLDKRTERKAVACADMCLTVSNQMNETYQNWYPQFSDKFICIQNGYDDITTSAETISKVNNFSGFEHQEGCAYRFGIFGKYGFYDECYYENLTYCVQEMKQRGSIIKVLQFGFHEEGLERCFEKNGLAEHYEYRPTEGYEKDLLQLQKCDATIATNFLKEALGTKIFDYIWVNRPIITINPYPDGEQRILTEQFENGYGCFTAEEMLQAFCSVVNLPLMNLDVDAEKRHQYGRNYQFNVLYQNLKCWEGEKLEA